MTRQFYSADERGSIISVTNNQGGLIGTAPNRYDEFGQPQSTNSGIWGYTGQAWLSSIGVWYYKARVYDPELGRFLQTDPIGYEDNPNLYVYVGNDPINLTDPLGLYGGFCVTSSSRDGSWTQCFSFGGGEGILRGFGGGAGGSGLGALQQRLERLFRLKRGRATLPRCPSGARVSVGIGGGLTGFLNKYGLSASGGVNLSIPLSSALKGSLTGAQFYGAGNLTFLRGRGLYAGIGPSLNVGVSGSPPASGTSSSNVVQAGAAFGPGAELTGTPGSDTGSAAVHPGLGYGGYAGRGLQLGLTGAFPPMGCRPR